MLGNEFGQAEGAIVSSMNKPERKFTGDVSSHKCVKNLKDVDGDREKFIEWNDKLLNAVSRGAPQIKDSLEGYKQNVVGSGYRQEDHNRNKG